MTMNGYFVLNSVLEPVCLAADRATFENNCVKTKKIDTYCHGANLRQGF